MHKIFIRLFTFDAAQNAPPAGGQPASGFFCTSDKQKNRASKVNKLTFDYTTKFQRNGTGSKDNSLIL